MQKKNDKILDKIVKKDYNNELELALEKKYFAENVKSTLLSIFYKIETAYKDYKQVKQNVATKEEFIQKLINDIVNNCEEIKLIRPNSEESKIIGNKTFLIEKKKKRIICYHIERKLLYCIAKISKKDTIIHDKYEIIYKTLSELINVGNNINTVEPLRDFNGYSWTNIAEEIESVYHNLIYQNLILLVGNDFMEKWVEDKDFIMDYMEQFQTRMTKQYGKEKAEKWTKDLKEISVLLAAKFDLKMKEEMEKQKEKVDKSIEKVKDHKIFVEEITKQKRKITQEIKNIDETLNNKEMLEEEYIKRNEKSPLDEKIFSIRVLSKIMVEEREEKIKKLEKCNELLKPKNFVKHKKALEEKEKYLSLLEVEDLQKEIDKRLLKLQKDFLNCFETRIEKCENRQDMLKIIYEFRYYCMIPYDYERQIFETKELEKQLIETTKKILEQAHKLKVIQKLSRNEEIDYQLLQPIFVNKSIHLEEISIKLTKEKETNKYVIHIFDENDMEETKELKYVKEIDKKDLELRYNKKVKAFY